MGSYEKAPPEHRVNPANPNVDIVSFGLRIVFHDAAQPRWTTPRPFLAPGLKCSRQSGDREKPGAERIAILGLGPGDYPPACLPPQVHTMFLTNNAAPPSP